MEGKTFARFKCLGQEATPCRKLENKSNFTKPTNDLFKESKSTRAPGVHRKFSLPFPLNNITFPDVLYSFR